MVSASQSTNSLGAVIIGDGGVPRIFTAVAYETVSGGYLVSTSGAGGDVGSDSASYVTSDIHVIGAQDIRACNGMALNNAVSGGAVSIATRGDYLMRAAGIVSGGYLVMHNASGNVLNWVPLTGSAAVQYDVLGPTIIGRAKTSANSGTNSYALIALNL